MRSIGIVVVCAVVVGFLVLVIGLSFAEPSYRAEGNGPPIMPISDEAVAVILAMMAGLVAFAVGVIVMFIRYALRPAPHQAPQAPNDPGRPPMPPAGGLQILEGGLLAVACAAALGAPMLAVSMDVAGMVAGGTFLVVMFWRMGRIMFPPSALPRAQVRR